MIQEYKNYSFEIHSGSTPTDLVSLVKTSPFFFLCYAINYTNKNNTSEFKIILRPV